MTDPALDMSIEAMSGGAITAPESDWLARRMLTFGASEIPALLIALGLEHPTAITPAYIRDAASRLFGVKAGTRKPAGGSRAAQMGNDVEQDLVREWNADILSGYPPATHASAVPREWLPLIDRHCPRLSCTPDAWCRVRGELINVQVKTDVHGGKRAVTLWWWTQVQAEMAVTGSASSLLLYGGGWACDWAERRERPVAWVVERDEAAIERIRSAVVAGWERVEAIKTARLSNARGSR